MEEGGLNAETRCFLILQTMQATLRLQEALVLKDQLSRCKHQKNSRLWKDICSAFERVLSDPHSMNVMFLCTDAWHNMGGSTAGAHTYFAPSTWFKSFPTRDIFLQWLESSFTCCVSLERLDLIMINYLWRSRQHRG